MTRVNISMPDDLAARARAEGLNVSRVASEAVADELDRRAKIAALAAELERLEAELGPVSRREADDAAEWVEHIGTAPIASAPKRRRRSA